MGKEEVLSKMTKGLDIPALCVGGSSLVRQDSSVATEVNEPASLGTNRPYFCPISQIIPRKAGFQATIPRLPIRPGTAQESGKVSVQILLLQMDSLKPE